MEAIWTRVVSVGLVAPVCQCAATVAGFLERALSRFARHGILTKRLMTDNAWIYTKSRAVQQLLRRHEIRHLTTQPYRT